MDFSLKGAVQQPTGWTRVEVFRDYQTTSLGSYRGNLQESYSRTSCLRRIVLAPCPSFWHPPLHSLIHYVKAPECNQQGGLFKHHIHHANNKGLTNKHLFKWTEGSDFFISVINIWIKSSNYKYTSLYWALQIFFSFFSFFLNKVKASLHPALHFIRVVWKRTIYKACLCILKGTKRAWSTQQPTSNKQTKKHITN